MVAIGWILYSEVGNDKSKNKELVFFKRLARIEQTEVGKCINLRLCNKFPNRNCSDTIL